MSQYHYKKLSRSRREIRLLHIHSLTTSFERFKSLLSRPSDETYPATSRLSSVFSIEEVSLDEAGSYYALSYSWESQTRPEVVSIDGLPLAVTQNLHYALTHLQSRGKDIRIWIDAICIDQTNSTEKTWQIALMNEVYSKAAKVIVWLGPASPSSHLAMAKIESAGKKALQSGLSILKERDELKWTRMLRADARLENAARIFMDRVTVGESSATFPLDAILELLKRSWWSRIWVVQEIALAREAEFVCGNQVVPALPFCIGLNTFRFKRAITIFQFQREPMPSEELRIMTETRNLHWRIPVEMWQQPQLQPLLSLLKKTCQVASVFGGGMGAYHLRDKVYGVLGLAKDVHIITDRDRNTEDADPVKLVICLNYGQPCGRVFQDIAIAFLERSLRLRESLDILRLCQGHGSRTLPGIPSWAPDWSMDLYSNIRTDYMAPFKTSRRSSPRLLICHNGSILAVWGLRFDVVLEIGREYSPAKEPPVLGAVDPGIVAFLDQFRRLARLGGLAYNNGELVEAVWRTPITDIEERDGRWERASPGYGQGYTDLCQGNLFLPPGRLRTALSYQSRLKTATLPTIGRRPFVTRRGFLGLGPPETESGDVVVVLLGAEMPFVLRNEGGYFPKYFTLVGECYVHGIMDGEFMESKVESMFEKFEIV